MSLRCCCSGLPPRVGCGLWTVGTVDRGRGDTPHPPRALARDAAARAAVAARARTQITYRVRGVPRVTHDEVGRDAVDFVPFCSPVPPVEPREGEREREAGCGGGGRCPVPIPNLAAAPLHISFAWRARRRDGALALRRRWMYARAARGGETLTSATSERPQRERAREGQPRGGLLR